MLLNPPRTPTSWTGFRGFHNGVEALCVYFLETLVLLTCLFLVVERLAVEAIVCAAFTTLPFRILAFTVLTNLE
jgi:hypothetical protein